MRAISDQELDALSLVELISRMDTFLFVAHGERYGSIHPASPEPTVSELMCATLIANKPEDERRRIAYVSFGYLAQVQFSSISSGIANRVLFDNEFEVAKWQSPVFRLRHAALTQYQIVCSRIAFEVFIDLLYVIETGQQLNSKKSKMRAIRKWLRSPKNRFHYFAHVLLEAYRFDREHRTPEVHGTSRLPRQILRLQEPSSEDMNSSLHLICALLNSWHPLLDILNERRPTQMQIFDNDQSWFHAFMSQDDATIEEKLADMLDEVQ